MTPSVLLICSCLQSHFPASSSDNWNHTAYFPTNPSSHYQLLLLLQLLLRCDHLYVKLIAGLQHRWYSCMLTVLSCEVVQWDKVVNMHFGNIRGYKSSLWVQRISLKTLLKCTAHEYNDILRIWKASFKRYHHLSLLPCPFCCFFYHVKEMVGADMSGGHNVGMCKKKHFTDSIQGLEQHHFYSGNALGTIWRCSERDVACRLLRQNWWTEA